MKTLPKPFKILQSLIRFDTTNPPGNEGACIAYIGSLMDQAGIDYQVYCKVENRPNLYARIRGKGSEEPLMLYGHVDVVTTANQEWAHDPFGGEIIDDVLWGRGAVDMKGGMAMMLSAFLRLKSEAIELPFDVIFLALSDEEVGGENGAKFMVEERPELFADVRYAIGEFGGCKLAIDGVDYFPIQVAEKVGCGLEIVVKGPAGHGSMVQQGGTMLKAAQLLFALDQQLLPVHITDSVRLMIAGMALHQRFSKALFLRLALLPVFTDIAFKILGKEWRKFLPLVRNTANITLIEGGNAVNVLPSEVRMNADVRLLPGYSPDDVISEIRKKYKGDAEFKVVYHSPNPAQRPDMGLFKVLSDTLISSYKNAKPVPFFMAGVTDARFFNRLGIQTYGYTPMELPSGLDFTDLVHAPNERVMASSIDKGADIIYNAIINYCEGL